MLSATTSWEKQARRCEKIIAEERKMGLKALADERALSALRCEEKDKRIAELESWRDTVTAAVVAAHENTSGGLRFEDVPAAISSMSRIIAKLERERDEATALAMHETEVARLEVRARGAMASEHKRMRMALEAIGEAVLVPGNWHPCEQMALNGMIAAARERETDLRQARADEREKCLAVGPFKETPPHMEPEVVCWDNGFNAGVAAYRDAIRALGEGDMECIICRKREAVLPDRNSHSARKRVCRECHADRLQGDLRRILEDHEAKKRRAMGEG